MNLLTRTATAITRQPVLDDDDLPVYDDWGNPLTEDEEVDVDGCWWEPRVGAASENTDGMQHVTSGLDFYCSDPAVDLDAVDAIVIDGLSYEVDGAVARYTGTRLVDHSYVALRRVTG